MIAKYNVQHIDDAEENKEKCERKFVLNDTENLFCVNHLLLRVS